MQEAQLTFKPLKETSYMKNLVQIFPDGFEMTYVDVWNLGGPSMERHWKEVDRLTEEHGGLPTCYLRNS